MKSVLPLIVLLIFFIFLAVMVIIVTSPRDLRSEQREGAEFLCASGETRSCQSGACEGISTCLQGVWSGCKWERVCTPGIHEPCIEQGCAYALKECNECGTGWGECLPIEIPGDDG